MPKGDTFQDRNSWIVNHVYDSPAWSSSVVPDKQRGLGIVEADDGTAGRAYQIDQIPNPDGKDKD